MKKQLYIIIIILNLIIIARVAYLTIYKHDYYQEILKHNQNRIILGMSAPRGRMLDVNGHILVDNIGVKSIIYNKLTIPKTRELEIAKILAENFEITYNISDYHLRNFFYQNNQELINNRIDGITRRAYQERKITTSELFDIKLSLISDDELDNTNPLAAYFYFLMNNGYRYQDKIIKTNITNEEYILINSLNLEGIRTDITWERHYPFGDTLKAVFGMVSTYIQGLPLELRDEFLAKGYRLNDRVGISNLEYLYDDYLRGEKAQFKVQNNQLTLTQPYQRGKDIVLSIDIKLQLEIERILEYEMINARAAPNSRFFNESYVVVSNPNDGSIMALVGRKIDDNKEFNCIANYNALNSFTVGSSIKGATIAVGYKYQIINERTTLIDSCVRLYGGRPRCSWRSLGRINDLDALRMSSNYFQYYIAMRLTGKRNTHTSRFNATEEHFNKYRNVLESFGLGNLTGIDLTNEIRGMRGTYIDDDLLLNIAIGQYDMYTPLQLSQYINTIATGNRTKMRLVHEVINHDGTIYKLFESEILNEVPISYNYLNRIREGLRQVNARGTGYGYTNQSFTSAGKTGTADSWGENNVFTYTTSYVMYAPFENPEVSITIVSPHIGYRSGERSYRYPINPRVIYAVSSLIFAER